MEKERCYLFALALAAALAVSHGQNPNLNCDFEQNANGGLCSWTQVTGTDQMDWKRQTGATASADTGPTTDHTLGQTGGGHYVYFETSTGATGSKAQLASPAITVARGQAACLTLWYHMYGEHVSTLTVYAGTTPLWIRSGDQGNVWRQARITISGPVSNKVIIEAVRGRGIRGDIAIDDVVYTPGSCSAGVTLTPVTVSPGVTAVPVAAGCDFDANLCGYTQDRTDNTDWTRAHGPTASTTTGPSTDHTTGTPTGFYMLFDAARTGQNGKARLLSPSFPGSTTRCLQFWYNMYGNNMGTFNVYAKSGNSLGAPIWTLTNDQGQGWQLAEVTVPAGQSFNAVFEGVRGNGVNGDIGLDDVLLKDGACPKPGSCNFDVDLCTYVNDKSGDDFDWIRYTGGTSSSGTGPTQDHTQGNAQGYYIYIEASAPRHQGDRAVLYSQVIIATATANHKCLSFWYNMHGANMGTLNVGMKMFDGSLVTRWTLSGDQGSVWKFGRVSINMPNPYKVFFEGVVGGIAGDIAIDDVNVANGWCAYSPANAQPASVTTTQPPTTASTAATATPPPNPQSVTCDFEAGLCSWTQLHDDNFDWTRHQGSTSSTNTGPSGDHTSGHGFYIYTEVSTAATNATARIQSKTITPLEDVQCLSFWYHMYGDSTGTLNFYIKTGSGLGSQVWTRTGSQGNQWTQAAVTVSQNRQSYAVVLEGIGGNGYKGDMAVDDIMLAHGACTGGLTTPQTGPTTTVAPGGTIRSCDFEANVCGYTQDTTDNFDWTQTNRGTSTTGTGPSSDHTYGTSNGHYMYIEASAQRLGQRARIISPRYADQSAVCLKFYYHMYGDGIGIFNVYAKASGSTSLSRAIFSRSGNQGNRWIVGEATVPQSLTAAGYQVVFEAIRGATARADIALDDVSVVQGACPSAGDCDFESGLCTWTNANQGDDFDWTSKKGLTGTAGTGPSTDHTLGTAQGTYVYIETSAPRTTGHKAWLVSENFPPVSSSGRCIHFWYTMYGTTVDTLNVYLRIAGQNDSFIWMLQGNQGNGWLSAQAPIPKANVDYSIVFEGVRGRSYTGDIAIDDVTFTEDQCSAQPSMTTDQVATDV